jgi:hypothetical protein
MFGHVSELHPCAFAALPAQLPADLTDVRAYMCNRSCPSLCSALSPRVSPLSARSDEWTISWIIEGNPSALINDARERKI